MKTFKAILRITDILGNDKEHPVFVKAKTLESATKKAIRIVGNRDGYVAKITEHYE